MTAQEFIDHLECQGRVFDSEPHPPASEVALTALCRLNGLFAQTALFDLLRIRNGIYFGDWLWHIWSVEEILEAHVEGSDILEFCDVMIQSEVYTWKADSTIIDGEGECIAREMNHFFERVIEYPDVIHLPAWRFENG